MRKREYFKRIPGAPEDLSFAIKRRVSFSEVDVMGIVWYGRYTAYFEEAQRELGSRCGLSYQDFFKANLRAPIVEFHIDYFKPLYLDEEFVVKAYLIWSEGAKLTTEYEIIKSDMSIATRAYMVQMFIDSQKNEPCIVTPLMLENLRTLWLNGEFACLRQKQ